MTGQTPRRAAGRADRRSQRSALVRFLSRKLGSSTMPRKSPDAPSCACTGSSMPTTSTTPAPICSRSPRTWPWTSCTAQTARYLEEEGARLQDDTAQQDPGTPEELVAARQQLGLIYRAIEDLPLRCRQALMLHRVRGLSYAEIARDMGVSVSSVEKYILEALKHCREHLIP